MSDKKIRRLPLAAAAMVACMSAHAGYTSPDGNFSLSGFGTLGAVRTTTDEALFNYPGQGGGAGKTFNLDADSKIAVQGTYKVTPSVSATAQVMTKYDANGDYVPNFEWAFVKWQPANGWAVRAGRMGAPFFMISDFRDVGYANVAVRPNLDVYGQVPVSYVDGGDVSYQANVGPANVTATVWGGNSKAEYSSALHSALPGLSSVPPVDVALDRMMGLNLQAEFDGGYSLRVGHMTSKLTTTSAIASTSVALAPALASTLVTDNTRATFSGIGFSVDRDNVVINGEYTKRRIAKGYVADTTGWYLLGGYRFGSVLPYVSFSRLKVDDPNADVSGFTPTNLAEGTGLAVAKGVLKTQTLAQHTTSVGVRWDVMPSVALKAQVDRIVKPANGNGLFLVPDSSTSAAQNFYANKKNINVFSVAADFVF